MYNKTPKKIFENKLLSFEEYNKLEHSTPYTYILSKADRFLFYFGSRHSYDVNDSQYAQLEKFWDSFTKTTHEKDQIVLIEGGKRPALKTKEEAIKAGGEMHYVAFLAKNMGIRTFSPEPPESKRYKFLLQFFSKEYIALYEFERICYQWNNRSITDDFEEYLIKYMKSVARESRWNDFDFSLQNMIVMHEKLLKQPFNKNDKKFFYNVINPTTNFSIVNKISRLEDDSFRDDYILKEIVRIWNERRNIFIIYGSSHAVRQEPALRNVIENK